LVLHAPTAQKWAWTYLNFPDASAAHVWEDTKMQLSNKTTSPKYNKTHTVIKHYIALPSSSLLVTGFMKL